jgi:hypothetical protein
MKFWGLLLLSALALASARAEDWTTTDGKQYRNVHVVTVEDDAVTILDSDGGARVPLATLGPDLQKRFHYDAAKAKIAAEKFAEEDKKERQAVEKDEQPAPKQAPATPPPAVAPPLVAPPPVPAPPATVTTVAPAPARTAGEKKAEIQKQIDSLQTQITTLKQDADQARQQSLNEFNSWPNIYYSYQGQVEHRHTLSHSQRELDDESQIADLQKKVAALQFSLDGTMPPPDSSVVSTPGM